MAPSPRLGEGAFAWWKHGARITTHNPVAGTVARPLARRAPPSPPAPASPKRDAAPGFGGRDYPALHGRDARPQSACGLTRTWRVRPGHTAHNKPSSRQPSGGATFGALARTLIQPRRAALDPLKRQSYNGPPWLSCVAHPFTHPGSTGFQPVRPPARQGFHLP